LVELKSHNPSCLLLSYVIPNLQVYRIICVVKMISNLDFVGEIFGANVKEREICIDLEKRNTKCEGNE